MQSIFAKLAEQLKAARKKRGLTQAELADRVGRSVTRISELERDLANDRWGRDRLTLFAEICDATDLVPVLVPRPLAARFEAALEREQVVGGGRAVRTAFDDVFVDLGDESE